MKTVICTRCPSTFRVKLSYKRKFCKKCLRMVRMPPAIAPAVITKIWRITRDPYSGKYL